MMKKKGDTNDPKLLRNKIYNVLRKNLRDP